MTLHVYNYARLDPAMITRAREVATAIFGESGVETAWIDCPISAAEYEKYPACHEKTETTHFVLRLMSASMAVKLPTSHHPLGFAHECRDDRPGCVANVFYARVEELAQRRGTPAAIILGHVMAHEIGHLLLGPNSDSSNGIMCGEWSLDDLRLMNWHHLMFTPGQAGQLRSSLLRRSTLEASLPPNVSGVPDPRATVRVYNYAEVSSGVLQGAEKEANRIFTAAGIDTVWVDCTETRVPAQSGSVQAGESTTDCFVPVNEAAIVLRILSRSTPASRAFRDTMFGFAEGSFVASVFYARVENFARGAYGNQTQTPVILGDVIAHEIGHLLLGTNSHSPSGIMCAKWDKEYLRLAVMGFQKFSPEQSALIRATVVRRHEASIQP